MKTKRFAVRGSYWYYVNKSELGKEYVVVTRPLSLAALRHTGMYVTSIDVPADELPKRVYEEAKKEGIIQ